MSFFGCDDAFNAASTLMKYQDKESYREQYHCKKSGYIYQQVCCRSNIFVSEKQLDINLYKKKERLFKRLSIISLAGSVAFFTLGAVTVSPVSLLASVVFAAASAIFNFIKVKSGNSIKLINEEIEEKKKKIESEVKETLNNDCDRIYNSNKKNLETYCKKLDDEKINRITERMNDPDPIKKDDKEVGQYILDLHKELKSS